MKFALGYQLAEEDEEPFVEVVRDFQDRIGEIYFPWADMPSGRAPLTTRRGYTDWGGQQQLEEDLRVFRQMGLKLDLLFNANCYGAYAISQNMENKVRSVLDHLGQVVDGVDQVTTTSLTVARTVKNYFPDVQVRGSVNMCIGTIKGMQYVASLFDAYYVRREFNRDLNYLRGLKQWADANDKQLLMLANSGCLAHCSGQIFHDNLVAHEAEIDEIANIPDWTPHVCWNFLQDPQNWPTVLQSTWVRPEDLHHYEELFHIVKLATRMHARPRAVITAYAQRRFRGNLLELFEPGFAPAFAPYIIDNEKFPEDWFERTSSCNRCCHDCDYCAKVLEQVLVRMAEPEHVQIDWPPYNPTS